MKITGIRNLAHFLIVGLYQNESSAPISEEAKEVICKGAYTVGKNVLYLQQLGGQPETHLQTIISPIMHFYLMPACLI